MAPSGSTTTCEFWWPATATVTQIGYPYGLVITTYTGGTSFGDTQPAADQAETKVQRARRLMRAHIASYRPRAETRPRIEVRAQALRQVHRERCPAFGKPRRWRVPVRIGVGMNVTAVKS